MPESVNTEIYKDVKARIDYVSQEAARCFGAKDLDGLSRAKYVLDYLEESLQKVLDMRIKG